MASWTGIPRSALEQELQEVSLEESDASEAAITEPRRPRWRVPAAALGAAVGLAALLAAAYVAWAPPRPPAGSARPGASSLGAAPSDRKRAMLGLGAGPGPLAVADLDTFESKAASPAGACQVPCGSGTCSSALADLLDGSTGSMPPGSDPECGSAQELVQQQCPFCSCCGDMCAAAVALGGPLLGAAPPVCNSIKRVEIELRDFNTSHPDFQNYITNLCRGLVSPTLAPDFTPVLTAGAPVGGNRHCKIGEAIASNASFFDWYHDTANNARPNSPHYLELCEDDYGFFSYKSDSYFPLDGDAWNQQLGDGNGGTHNYLMTGHFSNNFVIRGGEKFTFRGDDDVWVFFTKCDASFVTCETSQSQLGIDLGGVHSIEKQTVDLENQLGFKVGDNVRMDFFWAERHTFDSHLGINTSILLATETTTATGTTTTRTTTTRTTTTGTTTTGTTTTNTETKTTVTRTVTTTTVTTTTATTTSATTTTATTTRTTKTATTTSITTTATTTTPTPRTTVESPVGTVGPFHETTPVANPCEAGCDGQTCMEKLQEIISESGDGSSPPLTLPEAAILLLKMCPNCATCDPSSICPTAGQLI